jgi:hypothetical protein
MDGPCDKLLPHPAFTLERPVLGHSLSTCLRTELDPQESDASASDTRTFVRPEKHESARDSDLKAQFAC